VTVQRTHSTIFHFTKEPRYFAAMDEVREPQRRTRPERGWNVGSQKGTDGVSKLSLSVTGSIEYNPLGKLPGSVWNLTWNQVVERIVKGWAPTTDPVILIGTDSLPLGVTT